MLKQLKANKTSVPCTVGGGTNGYLAMLISATMYTTVAPGIPFVPPLMLAALVIWATDIQYQIVIVKTQYDRAMSEHQTYILMQKALNTIASQQESATLYTAALVKHLLNYCSTYPEAVLTYVNSDMVLHIHTNASFLSEPKAKSRVGGYFFISNNTNPSQAAHHNAPVHVICQILKNVLVSASEAEYCGMFENAQTGVIFRALLHKLGHKQPLTPIRTDNTTAADIINDTIKWNRSRTIDMRYHWLRERVSANQFHVYWDRGITNLGDFHTKHHPPWHCRKMLPINLNNFHNIKFKSSKGVLVYPCTPAKQPCTKTVKPQKQIVTNKMQFPLNYLYNLLIK